ncbi:hypothetical protein JTE90_005326 [Oedothorax gibbosus]|uniref:Uncharacterized protein n=1 Tax=Oedothorax gibbosus TaxID=931172 RepID=A0AAV6UHK8_9ARAC|nr:hypothetical protein JTE90_005326 [Oedothorax gibbosus]
MDKAETNGETNGGANGDIVETGEVKPPAKKKIMNAKKYRILASVVYGNLFLGSCYSLMAPIYPAEAERKHASASAYGLVFGVYEIVMFVSAPLYGKIMSALKPGFMMKTGMLVSGICVILFSCNSWNQHTYGFKVDKSVS